GALVPHTQLVHLVGHDMAHQPVCVVPVGVVEVPHIAGGGGAGAEKHRVRTGDGRLAAGGTGGKHQVVLRKIQRLKGSGHPGQQGAVNFGGKGQFLDVGGADVVVLEPGGHLFLVVHKGVDHRVREHVMHTVHHPVGARIG